MTLPEFVVPVVAGLVGARFGRHIDWPFPSPTSARSRRINARHDLNNGVFWAIFTCLVVSSGVTIIAHL